MRETWYPGRFPEQRYDAALVERCRLAALKALPLEPKAPPVPVKLNGVDPYAYLAATITKIVNGHPNGRLDEFLPWAYPMAPALRDVA
jgi:hypothetical protein